MLMPLTKTLSAQVGAMKSGKNLLTLTVLPAVIAEGHSVGIEGAMTADLQAPAGMRRRHEFSL
jgi:hypothetical protein